MCSRVERSAKRKLGSDNVDEPVADDIVGKKRKEVLINNKLLTSREPRVEMERLQLTHQQRKSLCLHNNIESPRSNSNSPVVVNQQDKDGSRSITRIKDRLIGRKSINGTVLNNTPGRNSPRLGSGTPLARRSQVPEEDITAVYTECIKLSAANKINSKNAFGLQLIDYMSYLIRHKPNEQINFKLVSSALDAGAKIYGHRVDCVQAEAQKVASGLVIALDKDKGCNDLGDDEDGEGDGGMNEDGETRPKKRKANKRTVKTIASNPESINTAKVECNTPPDPLFSQLSSSFDIGNVNGLLMSNLTLNDDGLLLLNHAEVTPTEAESPEVCVERAIFDSILSAKPQIVPKLSRFEFLARGEDLEGSMSQLRAGTQSQDKISFAMDGGISPSQDFESSIGLADNDNGPDVGGFFNNDSDSGAEENNDREQTIIENNMTHSMMRTVDSGGFDKLIKALSDEPSEYTYFNKELLRVWAGPEYWKVNPLAKRNNQRTLTAQKAPKSTKKTKNQIPTIDFTQSIIEEETGNKETKLKVQTFTKWTERLIPNDLSYDPIKLIKPFLKEGSTFSILKKVGIDPNGEVKHSEDNDDDSDGRCSPGVDQGIDPEMDDNYEDEFPPTQGFPTQAYSHDLGGGPFSGDNLVDEPYLVSSTQLAFSTHAKKIDVKRLKKEMWTIVGEAEASNKESTRRESTNIETFSDDLSTHQDSETIDKAMDDLSKTALPFSDLYKKLPDRVGTSMANNLSVPIAFVALLHLTNEKNLELQGRPDLSDFFIKPSLVES